MVTDFSRPRETRSRVREAARRVASFLHRVLPKANIAVIWGWPDYEDSVVALEQQLQRSSVSRVVLLLTDRTSVPPCPLGAKTLRVTKASPVGFVAFLVARYVFFTHRCFMRAFPPNVVSVNVWHGMPIKRVGSMLDESTALSSSHTIATSPMFADLMRQSMHTTQGVLVSGLPRNDRLYVDPQPALRAVGAATAAGRRKFVVWLPTYRQSVRGEIRVDGIPTSSVFGMEGIDPEHVNRMLAAHDAVGLVKAHPMAALDREQHFTHLHVVDDSWLGREGLTLYQVLGAADVLISDFSSVLVDFLLLDRPIVHAMADTDEYASTRGFALEPIEDYYMGPVASSANELADCLAAALGGDDPYESQRRRVRDLCHSHFDGESSQRLLSALGLL